MEYQIEKNMPKPIARNKFPLDKMEVGDSFVVPLKDRFSASSSAISYKRKHPETEFVTKKVSDDEVRIWRTK